MTGSEETRRLALEGGRPGDLAAERLSPDVLTALADLAPHERDVFALRLARSWDDLAEPLGRLYGDFPLDDLVLRLARAHADRSPELRLQDLARDLTPDWFQSERMVGYVFYVDRFAGSLMGVLDRLDYLDELGVTYVHFMPLLRPRPTTREGGDSDGGYSVMDYRAIREDLGSMDEFEHVCAVLRRRGISVCIDLVLNHTAKEHEWARAAVAGSARHLAMYRTFETREVPDAFEETLTEVFPDTAPGNFSQVEFADGPRWVWTTFNTHQWDLNWENPDVFLEIVDVMLFLANRGVECLRLDAVAFMWKRLGTGCQNLPEVHDILHALRAAARVASAALIHKEEAIVSPADLLPYLGVGLHAGDEGNLAYHNSLMVQFWGSLATGDVELATHVLGTHFPQTIENATWATYLRCHDDIGWAITDEDATVLGFSGAAHRDYLARFYEGTFPGSFAKGAAFQVNEETGDRRSNGTLASLAGLETAADEGAVSLATDRIVMGHSLIASWAGLPLLYMGDELGLLNDLSYRDDPALADDSRWLHRPAMDWDRAARRHEAGTVEARVFEGVAHVMARRKALPHLAGTVPIEVLAPPDRGVLTHRRASPLGALVALHNFTPHWRGVRREWLEAQGITQMHDALSQGDIAFTDGWMGLPPYARAWVV